MGPRGVAVLSLVNGGRRWFREMLDSGRAGAAYFFAVFAVGAILGPIRELWVAPRFGARAAELMEAPLMLLACIVAARWIMSRVGAAGRRLRPQIVGLTALGLLLFAELGVVVFVRQVSIARYVASRDPVAGSVYLLMLGLFAAMPWLVGVMPVKKGSL